MTHYLSMYTVFTLQMNTICFHFRQFCVLFRAVIYLFTKLHITNYGKIFAYIHVHIKNYVRALSRVKNYFFLFLDFIEQIKYLTIGTLKVM